METTPENGYKRAASCSPQIKKIQNSIMSSTNFDIAKPGKVTLYDSPSGPYPSRVRIALYEKNLFDKVSFGLISLAKGDHKADDFRSKNYSATIPILEFADGTILLECVAITQYIDNIDGSPVLTGATPFEQGLIHMWTRKVESEFLEPISIYFHNATPGLGPTVDLPENQNREWGIAQLERAHTGMRFFDNILKTRPYIAGDKFTMADAAGVGAVLFLGFINEKVPEDLVGLSAWWKRVQQQPSVSAYFNLLNA